MLIVAYTPSLIPQLLANQYASWRKIDYVTTFDFFFLFFHPSTLSLPPFPPFQRERKLGGEEWRGGEGEREGENKSPSVWLSPALSRLSNRGLRSSLLFNLSTEWKQSSSTRLGPPPSLSSLFRFYLSFFLLFSFFFTIGESLWFHPPRPLAFSPISPVSALLPLLPTAPSRHLPPTRRPVRARNHHFTTRYSTNSNLLAMSQFLYGSFSLFALPSPLRIIVRHDRGSTCTWIIRGIDSMRFWWIMHLCGERIQYYFSIFLIRSEEMFVNLLLDRSFFPILIIWMFRSIVDFYLFYHVKYCVKLYFIMRKLLFESKGLFYGKILILVFVIFNCETMSIGYDLINRVTCCY